MIDAASSVETLPKILVNYGHLPSLWSADCICQLVGVSGPSLGPGPGRICSGKKEKKSNNNHTVGTVKGFVGTRRTCSSRGVEKLATTKFGQADGEAKGNSVECARFQPCTKKIHHIMTVIHCSSSRRSFVHVEISRVDKCGQKYSIRQERIHFFKVNFLPFAIDCVRWITEKEKVGDLRIRQSTYPGQLFNRVQHRFETAFHQKLILLPQAFFQGNFPAAERISV